MLFLNVLFEAFDFYVCELQLITIIDKIDQDIMVEIEGNILTVKRPTEQKRHKAMHGLYRSLINNMVVGVSEGFQKDLEIIGVGYKAANQGNILELSLGYSHMIFMAIPFNWY